MSRTSNASIVAVYLLVLALVGVPMLMLISPSFEDRASIALALRSSAMLGFVVYIAIFIARPLRELRSNGFTQFLVGYRPYLGLGFAAVMTVHLALIGWSFIFVTGERPPWITLIFGGTAYALMFLMAMTTFPAAARAIGPQNWRRLHKTGLYFIGAIFLNALTGDILEKPTDPYYLAAAILIVLAIAIRTTAFIRKENQRTAAIESER